MARKQITENFTIKDIKLIETMTDVEDAREAAHILLDTASVHSKYPLDPQKVRVLHYNVEKAKDTVHVAWIFYNMLLAGEGLGTINSAYSAQFA